MIDFTTVTRPAFGVPSAPVHKVTRADRRYQVAALSAAALLPEIPQAGETVHALMLGNFDLCQVILATLDRVPNCRHVRIATLCYSRRNAASLLEVLDKRPVPLTLLVSVFFREHNKELHEWFATELAQHPGCRVTAARSHCKVVCFDLGDGDGLVFEGSANLRANRNREQLTVTRDRGLHDWHAEWIDELVSDDSAG